MRPPAEVIAWPACGPTCPPSGDPVELHGLPAPAKLNLFLHVTGRRADGYHLLETVFELIDFGDTLDFRRRDDGEIVRIEPVPGIDPATDLAVRAAKLLAGHRRTGFGVEISLVKRTPIGGGMGGGSSDAATTLLALNRLWQLHLPRPTLARLALELGADVPVFIGGTPAYATGVGEALRPLKIPPSWYVVVAPAVAVPTAVAFAAPELTRNSKPLRISGLLRSPWVLRGRNDLQPVVCRRYPEVARALARLVTAARQAGADPGAARMTGTGSCVFLPVADREIASAVAQRLAERWDYEWNADRPPVGPSRAAQRTATVIVARSLSRHPLADWAFAGIAAGAVPRPRGG